MKRHSTAFVLFACLTATAQAVQAAQITISCGNNESDTMRPWSDSSQPTWKEIIGPRLITIDTAANRVVSVHARLEACSQRRDHSDLTWEWVNDNFSTQRFDQDTIAIDR